MSDFEKALDRQLSRIREQHLHRELRRIDSPQAPVIRMGGAEVLNFSSNDYLGLANDPALREAALKAVERYGAGSGASRLISGSLAPHHELEEALADFKGAEAALTFSSGYNAAIGTLGALLGKGDVVIIDKLVHASIVDAARQCGAKLRVFPHNNLDKLESHLEWADRHKSGDASSNTRRRTLVVTESVFSMDGDLAPLRDIVHLKERHGAWLMVDEAHATGLFGERRTGLAEEFGVSDRIEIQMGTLGKALGSGGGYVCGSRKLIDTLINQARSYIFSTAPVPAAAAAARAAIEFVKTNDGYDRCQRLWAMVEHVKTGLIDIGYPPPPIRSAIIPLVLGDEARTMETAAQLLERGIYVPGIRFPSVPRAQARLRLTVTASHTLKQVQQLTGTFHQVLTRLIDNGHWPQGEG